MDFPRCGGGWLDPHGNAISCAPFSHINELEKLPDFADLAGKGSKNWDRMIDRAYKLGYVRVVINSGNVYAEGRQRAIARSRTDLKDLAAMLGEDATVVPTYRRA